MKVPVPTVSPHIHNLALNSTKAGAVNDTKAAGVKLIKTGLEPPVVGGKKVACFGQQCDNEGKEIRK